MDHDPHAVNDPCALHDALPLPQPCFHTDIYPSSIDPPPHHIFRQEPLTDAFPPQSVHHFTASSGDWECPETLQTVPDENGRIAPFIATPLSGGRETNHSVDSLPFVTGDADDASRHTVSTRGAVVHRVVLGESNWSRGIFSPDSRGSLTFRFVGTETQSCETDNGDDALCKLHSSLSISESDVYEAVTEGQVEEPVVLAENTCSK